MENAYRAGETDFRKHVTVDPTNAVEKTQVLFRCVSFIRLRPFTTIPSKLRKELLRTAMKNLILKIFEQAAPRAPHLVFEFSSLLQPHGWRLTKIDVKSASLQTGKAQRNVFVVPPYERKDKPRFLWLLKSAAYGLVDAKC